ncbi:nuclear transport factor 2 family protein [Spirosoma migulaei]
MNTPESIEPFEDGLPFVNEACGDDMWDEVLAQPPYNPALRAPVPPFTLETALQKVQLAENAWNSRDPEKVSLAYTEDTEWRNRTEFINGREAVKAFLTRKWEKELDYKLKKELWGFRENRMAVQFNYEWHDAAGQWYRSYGNELWEFDENGLMRKRFASINDLPIQASERQLV